MALVKKFKAQRDTKRYRKNQDVWIQLQSPNHLRVIHKWRGKGRYVQSYVSMWNNKQPTGNPDDEVFSLIGSLDNIREIEVDDSFAERHKLQRFD